MLKVLKKMCSSRSVLLLVVLLVPILLFLTTQYGWTFQEHAVSSSPPRRGSPRKTRSPADSPSPPQPLYEVRPSLGKGLGVFATVDIPARTRILKERPFLPLVGDINEVIGDFLLHHPETKEIRALVNTFYHYSAKASGVGEHYESLQAEDAWKDDFPPEAHRAMDRLVELAMTARLGKEPAEMRRKVFELSDAFSVGGATKTVGGIVKTNAWAEGGLFESVSRLNHGCEGYNVLFGPVSASTGEEKGAFASSGRSPKNSSGNKHTKKSFQIVAARDIVQGEELFVDYGAGEVEDPDLRNKWLKVKYNFECGGTETALEDGVDAGKEDESEEEF